MESKIRNIQMFLKELNKGMIPSEISFKTKRATEDFNDLKELFEMHQESYMLRVKARV